MPLFLAVLMLGPLPSLHAAETTRPDACSYLEDVRGIPRTACLSDSGRVRDEDMREALRGAPERKLRVAALASALARASGPDQAAAIVAAPEHRLSPLLNERTFPAWLAADDPLLPRGPAELGIFELHHGKTTFRAAPGVAVKLNGQTAGASMPLMSDPEGKPDLIQFHAFTMFVIHRGERYGIRLKDTESESRKEFTGLHWFPVRENYRVTAKFVPYQMPKILSIPNILGETEQDASPGYVLFTLDGHSLRLDPVVEDDQQLFFIFHDLTSGKETYPPGRFLYTDLPKNGEVVMDFNKAQNPPCAFTAYATCPLPPKQNRLPVRIEAGELNYGHH